MIIVDTGFWLALADDQDSFHQQARFALTRYEEPLVTTWAVITETCYLLLTRKGSHAPVRFVRSLEQGVSQIFELGLHHASRLAELMQQYGSLPMDLADASLMILAEHLGHGRIFSTDQRDFNAYRWKNTHPFENLLLLQR
jgi:hypothetical protein